MAESDVGDVAGRGTDVLDDYRRRWEYHDTRRERAAGRSRRLSTVRGFTFLGGVAAIIAVDFLEGPSERVAWAGLAAILTAFVVLVVRHRRVREEERQAEALAQVAREGVLRGERRWSELEDALSGAERAVPAAPAGHPYAADLDLIGRASLWRLLGPVTASGARARLRGWLLEPGIPEEARARQEALRELAPQVELRSEFTAAGRRALRDDSGSWNRLLGWLDEEPVMESVGWTWVGILLPLAFVGTVLADVLGGAGAWWALVAVPQLWVFRRVARRADPAFHAAATAAGPARAAVPQLRLLDGAKWDSPGLATLSESLGHGPEAAYRGLGRLLRLLDTVESRRNIVYASLAPVLQLELHLLQALGRWRSRHGRNVERWLEASFEWEALAALATLAHDHPDWAYPQLTESSSGRIVASQLGHPLLAPERCVGNDIELGPPGRFLLVTGSNMSGKSTLLRAIGLNSVLAGAGAPVCAGSMETPCARVYTCMRIEDSLEEGVSLFMAELLRIRAVVDAAQAPDPHGRPLLYLLDEMLHGTNTAERRVAARGVVRHLLETGALGAVSTHDLAFAEVPELLDAAEPVHFREQILGEGPDGRPRISFDYRMRPGIATTRNALKLLEAVGLSLSENVTPPSGPIEGVR